MRNGSVNKNISSLVDHFRKRRQVVTVYLFGSRAKKEGHGWKSAPDIDLAILLESRVPRTRYLTIKSQLIRDVEKVFGEQKVDLILLNGADPIFCHEVFACRKILFEGDSAQRIEFEARKENEYFDFQPYQEHFNRQILGI